MTKPKITILVGPMCGGKSTLQKTMIERDGYTKIITETDRPIREGEIDGYTEIISNILEANNVKNVKNMRNRALVRNGYCFEGERLVITLSGFPQKGRPGSYLVRNERGVFIIMSPKNLLETYPKFKTTVELDLERSKRCHTS